MKIQIKFISLLLAVLLMLGSMTVLSVFGASAAEEGTGTGTGSTDKKEEEEETIDYTSLVYTRPEEKLETMECYVTKGNYELYIDTFSGEVAYKNTKTGEILFTNPYDIGTSTLGSSKTKMELLSQIIIRYTDNNTSTDFVSYEKAALENQITVKRIKNGIRVQYTLGREQARKLVPGMMSVKRFEEVICAKALENGIPEFDYKKLTAFYLKLTLEGLSERGRAELIDAFPIVEKMEVYVFDQNASEVDKNRIEGYIKTYCPEYTYEDLDADHAETEYESQDKNPPLFKLALEYTLDENGLTVRLPANGIRFNESLYQLEYIQVLPYMGAGNSAYDGYTFYPDGAGSLYEFDDIADTKTRTVRGKVYGTDYAYHTITGTYQQAIRYPVFGVVENSVYYDYTSVTEDSETGEMIEDTTRLSGTIVDQINRFYESMTGNESYPTLVEKYGALIGNNQMDVKRQEVDRGYVAIMEEGDALTDIMTFHAGSLSDYNTIKMVFNPRPSDSYNLQDSISVGSDATWTVVSERKYVGNYKIRYIMLSDNEIAKANNVEQYYETSWMGMALAYRDYLDRNGYLTRLTAEEVGDDIPLYIETFGALETTERIMSIPVDVMTPLTTFEDVKTMYDELAAEGITNINFKLTGYANGGMYSIVPSKLKWEKAVGGKDGFQELVNYAAEVNKTEGNNLGIFPDFDFSYINETSMFDGVSLRWHAVRTIDDRYASYREYSATEQKHVSHYQMAISPASFSEFYEKLATNYLKYDNVNGISVGTLGNTLNSDFDEDDPYNREDSKEFVATALEYLSGLKNNQGQEVELMSEGGNAFTWKFLDHLLDVALDSSRNNDAAHAVPFVGVVLHGYVNFTGSPMNMEGNIQYAMLKAIENGASPYYILSYRNTQNLKDYYLLSHYYSVRYDIWKDDVIDLYDELNGVLGDVQDKLIIDHEFWTGTRVPDSDELFDDIQSVLDEYLYAEENANEVISLREQKEVNIARTQAREAAEAAIASLSEAVAAYNYAKSMETDVLEAIEKLAVLKAEYEAYLELKSEAEYDSYAAYKNAEEGTEEAALYQEYLTFKVARSRFTQSRSRCLTQVVTIHNYWNTTNKLLTSVQEHLANAEKAIVILEENGVREELVSEADEYRQTTDKYLYGQEFTILLDKYKKTEGDFTPEKDIAAIEAKVLEFVTAAFEANKEDMQEELAKAIADYEAAKATFDEAKAEADAAKAEAQATLTGDELEAKLAEIEEALAAAQAKLDEAATARNTAIEAAYTTILEKCVLTDEQKDEISNLCHFEYDYAKANGFNDQLNNLVKYCAEKLLSAETDYVASDVTYAFDFTQSSYSTLQAEAKSLLDGFVESFVMKYDLKQKYDERTAENEGTGSTTDEDEEIGFDKYAVEEGSIVVVTYGGKNGVDADPYKSIILNYNNFSVSIEYQGLTYTLPAYGYVVVMQ